MNAPEYRKRNLRLGILLATLFVALFIMAMTVMITGIKLPTAAEDTIKIVGAPILGFMALLPLVVLVLEIVLQARKKGESFFSNLVAPFLGVIGLLLVIGIVIAVVFEILRTGESNVSDVQIFLGTIGLAMVITAAVGNRYSRSPKDLRSNDGTK